MFDIKKLYDILGGDSGPGVGYAYALTDGNSWDKMLNTPNLWGHDPADTDYIPAAQNLIQAISDLIASAEQYVDISTLYHLPDGYFLQAISQGVKRARAAGNKIIIRFICGLQIPYHIPHVEDELKVMVAGLDPPEDVQVFVGAMQLSIDSTCHAKLIVVDGKTAICGGHNMWSIDYTQAAPAHDLSMQLSGPAVGIAQEFLNRMWTVLSTGKPWKFYAFKAYEGSFERGYIQRLNPEKPSVVGNTQVLAVARMALLESDPKKYDPSQIAKLAGVSMCESHIRLTTPWMGGSVGGILDEEFVTALCQKILQKVQVSIIMSEHGGTTSNKDIYSGESIKDTATAFVRVISKLQHLPRDILIELLDNYLHIAPIRIYPKQPRDPQAETWKWNYDGNKIEPANHAKVYIFDDQAFYCGSHNAYKILIEPGLVEYGFIYVGLRETAEFIDAYWNRGWQYSKDFEFKDWNRVVP